VIDRHCVTIIAVNDNLLISPGCARLYVCGVLTDYVPPLGKGALYLRPLLMGSGPILGLGPAPSYTFAIYAAAVGSYFKVRHCDHQ